MVSIARESRQRSRSGFDQESIIVALPGRQACGCGVRTGQPAARARGEEVTAGAALRRDGQRVLALLERALDEAHGRRVPVVELAPVAGLEALLPARFPRSAAADGELERLLAVVLQHSIRLHHPRFTGHQVSAPHPLAALCELVSAVLNNGMAVYEMGPAANVIEQSVLRFLADALALGPGAGGLLTSGGSLGNLTALLAMRRARAGFDSWNEPAAAGPPLAVLCSPLAHYCVDRAARIMGWGARGARAVAADDAWRLDPAGLGPALAMARDEGRRVIGVVANACATATGLYDPLPEIADFCAAHGLWLHVDGAHGAAAALSPRHRALVRGIERADSVIWDAHKMLGMPALCTAVLFRDRRHADANLAQDADYLFVDDGPERHDSGRRTLECTKRMMGLPLYACLRLLGTDAFAAHVDALHGLAATFADRIEADPRFELALRPQSNIVCFRWRGEPGLPPAALDALQSRIRGRLVAEGGFYLVQATLGGRTWLRTALMNPATTPGDLDALREAIATVAGGT